MKKFSILLSLALAVGFTACDDIEDPMPPQSNPQETVMAADGVTVAHALPADLKLQDFVDSEKGIPVLNITQVADQPEGSEVNVEMQLSSTEDFAKPISIPATVTDNVAYVDYRDWDNAHRQMFGKSPAAKTTFVRFELTLTYNSTTVRFGGADTYFDGSSVSVTPIDLNIKIESAYYVVTDAMFGDGWDASAIKLGHSDQSVYDDPVFTSICTLPAGSIQFIGAESMEKAKADAGNEYMYAWGPEESVMNGNLIYGENAKPIEIKKAGDYTVTINMMEGTFSVQAYTPILYAVGAFNGWGHNKDVFIYERNKGVHSGLIDMTKGGASAFEFKFSTETNWNGTNYGLGADEGTLSTDPGAGNLKLPKGGIYYFKVDTNALTWEALEITSFGIIGDATPGGWNEETALTYEGNLVWKAEVALVGGKEYKFRANNDPGWKFSLGGSLDNLDENNGANLKTTEDGTYVVTLDLSNNKTWKASVVKK